jgi:hypothetical protein
LAAVDSPPAAVTQEPHHGQPALPQGRRPFRLQHAALAQHHIVDGAARAPVQQQRRVLAEQVHAHHRPRHRRIDEIVNGPRGLVVRVRKIQRRLVVLDPKLHAHPIGSVALAIMIERVGELVFARRKGFGEAFARRLL